ncbi:protoporphyrinogen oxidase [Halobiforma lacisalsi AJ5]|uniref:Protoporphyrinogen oxidase n=1 Tax=Natronobacterium lacisalsi AJ5 TaxID=358396 RepID=M0LKM7_NATLA|nr:protoporphyrinogen oxidase [Halobiforma lacisalsi]APW98679.1 protoporphyrinogen oxidase [Halobiforma lacisalsi AJ5]EMA32550.1 protoporphyrinogen oxidase [Halobiforma lacisalsi AJ5]
MTVGVVGAGISGLTLVRSLEERGVDVAAFEARDEPGGVMRSRQVDGRVLELGPQRLRLTPGIESLVEDLELRDQLRIGDDDQPLYVYHDGSLEVVPLSVQEAITTDLLSPLGKLRILKEPFTDPQRPGETVDEFLVRKFGRQAARRYFGPLYSGLYGTDPRDMLMEYSLGRALDGAGIDGSILTWVARKVVSGRDAPPICSFDDGLGKLSERLYEEHADSIALETPVERIEEPGEGYEIVTPDGTERVDDVVLTTPAPTSAALLESVDDGLARTLRSFNYNPIGMVFVESDLERDGIGALVPSGSDVGISGSTWNASFLDRDRLFTCYVDPASDPEMPDRSDEELGAVAAAEFERLTGASATPIHVHRWDPGMPAYDRSWTAMDDLQPPEGIHFCANYVGRPGIPGRIRNAKRLAGKLAGDEGDRSRSAAVAESN